MFFFRVMTKFRQFSIMVYIMESTWLVNTWLRIWLKSLNLLMNLYSNLANFCCETDSKWSTTGGVVVLWHWDYCNSYSLFSQDEVSKDPNILAVHFWNTHCHKTESVHLTKRVTLNSLLHYRTTNMLLAYFGKCGIAFW